MACIVKEIIYNFDDKWMRVLFHEPDFVVSCLLISLVEEFQRILRPLDCEYLLVMLPNGHENVGKATRSNKVVLVRHKGVGLIALHGNTKYLRA
jgi:hypothetical protein